MHSRRHAHSGAGAGGTYTHWQGSSSRGRMHAAPLRRARGWGHRAAWRGRWHGTGAASCENERGVRHAMRNVEGNFKQTVDSGQAGVGLARIFFPWRHTGGVTGGVMAGVTGGVVCVTGGGPSVTRPFLASRYQVRAR